MEKQLKQELVRELMENPESFGEVFGILSQNLKAYLESMERKQDLLASSAILDLIYIVTHRASFDRLPIEKKKELTKNVIRYQFPNGITTHSQCEKDFYNKYS